jgi:Tfp pilus assembly protein PilO
VAVFGISLEGKSPLFGLVLGVVLGGVAAGVFYKFVAVPRQEEIEKKAKKYNELQVKIDEGRAAEKKLEQFRAEVRRLELELEKLLSILPARRNTPELLRRVRTLAEQGDFDFAQFKPSKMIEKEFYSEWPITVDLSGNYHNLALFFDRISRFRRLLNIDNLKIDAIKDQTNTRTIKASFIAKTFVYTETETPTGEENGQEPSP